MAAARSNQAGRKACGATRCRSALIAPLPLKQAQRKKNLVNRRKEVRQAVDFVTLARNGYVLSVLQERPCEGPPVCFQFFQGALWTGFFRGSVAPLNEPSASLPQQKKPGRSQNIHLDWALHRPQHFLHQCEKVACQNGRRALGNDFARVAESLVFFQRPMASGGLSCLRSLVPSRISPSPRRSLPWSSAALGLPRPPCHPHGWVMCFATRGGMVLDELGHDKHGGVLPMCGFNTKAFGEMICSLGRLLNPTGDFYFPGIGHFLVRENDVLLEIM